MSETQSGELFCGVDLGGTSAKLGLADATGKLVCQDSFSTQTDGNPETVIALIGACCKAMLERVGKSSNASLSGLGMGVPGLVDVKTGVTKFLPNLPTQWRDVPVAKRLGELLGCPVRLMNDARTATLGELRFGCGRGHSDLTFAFFSIGTGIGGGIAINGQIHLGPLGAAGELGHQTILPYGPSCGCGNRGCLETLASGPAIAAEGVRLVRMGLAPRLREITQGDADRVTTETMGQAAEEDPLVAEAINQAAEFIGIAAANVVSILHPDRIVLGGGVSHLGPRLTEPVKRVIGQRVGMFPTDKIVVECSQLGSEAGLRGAIALATDWKSVVLQY
ncbi:MAG: ROK family protein [Planctomycetales bacterium]|nr:ROK family protein [Planctomycetales bacterium]